MRYDILLVDNNISLLEKLGLFLNKKGYSVMTFYSAYKAIREIKGELEYKLALIDLSMSRDSGADVMQASKMQNPNVPVVCLSGIDPTPLPYYMDNYVIKGGSRPISKILEKVEFYLKKT